MTALLDRTSAANTGKAQPQPTAAEDHNPRSQSSLCGRITSWFKSAPQAAASARREVQSCNWKAIGALMTLAVLINKLYSSIPTPHLSIEDQCKQHRGLGACCAYNCYKNGKLLSYEEEVAEINGFGRSYHLTREEYDARVQNTL